MKTFATTFVLACVVAALGNVASANFDDGDVRNGANQIKNLATQAAADVQSGEIETPAARRRLIAVSFRSIANKAQQIANLSSAENENAVQAEMLQLAREIRQTVRTLTNQATGNAELLEILDLWADLSDELIDDLD